jgi:cilia- and flagella-associated protein 57
LLELEN